MPDGTDRETDGLMDRHQTSACMHSAQQVRRNSVKAMKILGIFQLHQSSPLQELNVPYGIIQCYLPPGRGDIPAFIPAH